MAKYQFGYSSQELATSIYSWGKESIKKVEESSTLTNQQKIVIIKQIIFSHNHLLDITSEVYSSNLNTAQEKFDFLISVKDKCENDIKSITNDK